MKQQKLKQTEIGMIPEDWEVKTIKDICSEIVRGPFGGSLKKECFVEKGIKVYEQKNAIYEDVEIGKYYIDNVKFNELKRFEIKEGDFIISCSGTIGKIFKIPKKFEKGIINQALLKIKINTLNCSEDYFLHYFRWDKFQKKIIESTQGGAMKNLIGMSEFKKTLIPISKNIEEQSAIAQVLSNTDTLLESLDKLIEKKKNIKQGTMQQLLTGKRRLSGFKGEWKTTTLGKVATFGHGFGLSKSELNESGLYDCIHYGQLFTEYKELIVNIKSKTNNNLNATYSQENDVLMPTSDVTPRGLATASCIREKGIILGGGILIIRLNLGFDGLFLSYFITQNKNAILRLVKGSTVFHLYSSDLSNLEFSFPEYGEQKAIAEILSDMDLEIEELERKKDKYQKIKVGMMQELLTGRIRLI